MSKKASNPAPADDIDDFSSLDDLQRWATLAKSAGGRVRCETLGVYIITDECYNSMLDDLVNLNGRWIC